MREFIKEESGGATIEVILILVVLIGLVIIFKDEATKLINSLFHKINLKADKL